MWGGKKFERERSLARHRGSSNGGTCLWCSQVGEVSLGRSDLPYEGYPLGVKCVGYDWGAYMQMKSYIGLVGRRYSEGTCRDKHTLLVLGPFSEGIWGYYGDTTMLQGN